MRIQISGQGMPVTAIVTGVHGNEKAPVHALNYVSFPKKGTYITIVANEEALTQNKRFCTADLNRIFPGDITRVDEYQLAAMLKKVLEGVDYVLDLHTTTAQTPAFVIYTKAKELATYVPLYRAVHMTQIIAQGKSLVDHVSQGISLEFASTTHPTKIASVVSDTLKAIIDDRVNEQQQHFEVFGILTRDACQTDLTNFKVSKIGGEEFVPILSGETSYANTLCLKARIVEK